MKIFQIHEDGKHFYALGYSKEEIIGRYSKEEPIHILEVSWETLVNEIDYCVELIKHWKKCIARGDMVGSHLEGSIQNQQNLIEYYVTILDMAFTN